LNEGVVEKDVYEDFKKVYELECEMALKDDRSKQSRSEILEMLLCKGLRAYFMREGIA